jgi:hypothetical protein
MKTKVKGRHSEIYWCEYSIGACQHIAIKNAVDWSFNYFCDLPSIISCLKKVMATFLCCFYFNYLEIQISKLFNSKILFFADLTASEQKPLSKSRKRFYHLPIIRFLSNLKRISRGSQFSRLSRRNIDSEYLCRDSKVWILDAYATDYINANVSYRIKNRKKGVVIAYRFCHLFFSDQSFIVL